MKIVFEDAELEKFVLSGDSPVALPFEIFVPVSGEAELTAYSCFENEALEFARRFSDDPLCPAAQDFLTGAAKAEMERAGYFADSRSDNLIRCFTAEKGYKSKAECPYEIVKISTNKEFERYYNNASRDVELDDGDPCDVCFAAVSEDVILSFAGVNDLRDDGAYEINVETAVQSRGQGCAAAVAGALAEYLDSLGERASYRCRSSNRASIRVAEKCGFTERGACFSAVFYNGKYR